MHNFFNTSAASGFHGGVHSHFERRAVHEQSFLSHADLIAAEVSGDCDRGFCWLEGLSTAGVAHRAVEILRGVDTQGRPSARLSRSLKHVLTVAHIGRLWSRGAYGRRICDRLILHDIGLSVIGLTAA